MAGPCTPAQHRAPLPVAPPTYALHSPQLGSDPPIRQGHPATPRRQGAQTALPNTRFLVHHTKRGWQQQRGTAQGGECARGAGFSSASLPVKCNDRQPLVVGGKRHGGDLVQPLLRGHEGHEVLELHGAGTCTLDGEVGREGEGRAGGSPMRSPGRAHSKQANAQRVAGATCGGRRNQGGSQGCQPRRRPRCAQHGVHPL